MTRYDIVTELELTELIHEFWICSEFARKIMPTL